MAKRMKPISISAEPLVQTDAIILASQFLSEAEWFFGAVTSLLFYWFCLNRAVFLCVCNTVFLQNLTIPQFSCDRDQKPMTWRLLPTK